MIPSRKPSCSRTLTTTATTTSTAIISSPSKFMVVLDHDPVTPGRRPHWALLTFNYAEAVGISALGRKDRPAVEGGRERTGGEWGSEYTHRQRQGWELDELSTANYPEPCYLASAVRRPWIKGDINPLIPQQRCDSHTSGITPPPPTLPGGSAQHCSV